MIGNGIVSEWRTRSGQSGKFNGVSTACTRQTDLYIRPLAEQQALNGIGTN